MKFTNQYYKTLLKLKKAKINVPIGHIMSFEEYKVWLNKMAKRYKIKPSIPVIINISGEYDIEKGKTAMEELRQLAIQGLTKVLTPEIPEGFKLEIT